MTHYQKLATLIFRILGIILFIPGLVVGSIILAVAIFATDKDSATNAFVIHSFWIILSIFGSIVFAASKLMAKVVTFGINE